MAFTQVAVTGTYRTPAGGPASGAVRFTPEQSMRNSGVIVAAVPVVGQLNASGEFTVSLAATTDPATNPTGVRYRVEPMLTGASVRQVRYLTVPHNGLDLDLGDASTVLEEA